METKKYSNKRTLRLIIVVLYLLLGLPFQFNLISRHILQTHDLILMLIIFNIFLFSEIVEYFFQYPSKEKRLVRYTFIIRLFFTCFSLIYTYTLKGNIQPFYYNYVTLICFYSYFLFGSKKSSIFTICFAVLTIFSDLNNFFVIDIDFYYRLLMTIQRVTIIMIFYLFAKFWDDDRKNSIENEILLKELNQSKEELKIFASKIAKSSVLEERTRIARDMHDSIGHSLTAIQIQLRTASAFLDIDNNRSRKSINAALEVAKTSLLDTRSVLNDLRSPEKQFSFKSKLINIITTLEQSGIEVSYNICSDDEEVNYACLLALFRFAQESSTNIIKHSKATKATINLTYSDDNAQLTIEDNGIGYDLETIKNSDITDGMGIKGLNERFDTIRGKVIIESQTGIGTKLTAITPKDPIKLIGEKNESY